MRKSVLNSDDLDVDYKGPVPDYKYFLDTQPTMNPWFLTGFTDGEGCFMLSMGLCPRNNKYKVGWRVKVCFQIEIHQKDNALLEQIKNFFDKGNLFIPKERESVKFLVQSVKDLQVIIDHFDNYPLITQKRADYELFKQAVELMEQKEHLTMEGLEKIVAIKASLNNGLSAELKAAFPEIIPVPRPSVVGVTPLEIKDPNWLAGFTSAEGCLFINIKNSYSHSLGFQVLLEFKLIQHSRDIILMRSLIELLNCGYVYSP